MHLKYKIQIKNNYKLNFITFLVQVFYTKMSQRFKFKFTAQCSLQFIAQYSSLYARNELAFWTFRSRYQEEEEEEERVCGRGKCRLNSCHCLGLISFWVK